MRKPGTTTGICPSHSFELTKIIRRMQLKSGTEEIAQGVNNLRWTLWDHWGEGSMLESIMPELGKPSRRTPEAHWISGLVSLRN